MLLQKGQPTLSVRFAQNLARAEYIQHLYEVARAQDRKHIWFRTFGNTDFGAYDQLFYPIHEYKGSKRIGNRSALKILGNY